MLSAILSSLSRIPLEIHLFTLRQQPPSGNCSRDIAHPSVIGPMHPHRASFQLLAPQSPAPKTPQAGILALRLPSCQPSLGGVCHDQKKPPCRNSTPKTNAPQIIHCSAPLAPRPCTKPSQRLPADPQEGVRASPREA